MCVCPTYWSGAPGLDFTAGSGGLADGGGGLGIAGLLCRPVLGSGECGGWPGSGGWLESVWMRDRVFDTAGLWGAPPTFTGWGGGRLGLMRWLPSDWVPPALRAQWAGPFSTILDSNWSQMGRVAGEWIDTAGRTLLSFPSTPTDVALLWRVLFALGGGGSGGVEERVFCRWGAKGIGGGGPLLASFSMEGGGKEGGGFLGRALFGFLCWGGAGGAGPLWKPGLESWRSGNTAGTGGGG